MRAPNADLILASEPREIRLERLPTSQLNASRHRSPAKSKPFRSLNLLRSLLVMDSSIGSPCEFCAGNALLAGGPGELVRHVQSLRSDHQADCRSLSRVSLPSHSYRARRRSLRSPHDPLQCRTHTPARHAPPSQATSACQRISAADRAGRPPQRVVVVVLLIAVRLGSGLAGGGGGRRGEGLAAVAEPDAEPTYLCRRRRWRCAGGSAAALDAAHTATRREHVMRILVHVHTCTTSLFVHTTHSLFTITITPTTRTYVDDRLAQYICICHS
ncbi:hypothetical protein V8E53_001039 [Lactarius tabidus]|jgi:hypothetical protein